MGMRIAGMVGLLLALNQAPDNGAPRMPYVDQGACPFECCTYRDWVAEAGFQAVDFWTADGAGKRKPAFKIVKGERVTAMSGVVLTTQPGVVRMIKPGEIEVYSKRLPQTPAEKIRLSEGDRLYIFTSQGEGYVSGWFKGRVLESFDTFGFAPAADCDKLKGGCVGIVERRPESEWWVKVRNRQGAIGWVRMPAKPFTPGFDKMDACG
jgi:hypothetical protein